MLLLLCICAHLPIRIFRTPIPLVYTRHTSRFLLVWLTILPFCTAGQVGWLSVPIACAMAFFLLGIEEIGVQVRQGGREGGRVMVLAGDDSKYTGRQGSGAAM